MCTGGMKECRALSRARPACQTSSSLGLTCTCKVLPRRLKKYRTTRDQQLKPKIAGWWGGVPVPTPNGPLQHPSQGICHVRGTFIT